MRSAHHIRHGRGFTVIEVLLTISIAVFVVGSAMGLLVLTVKAFHTLNTQMRGQMMASRELQRISNELRNAQWSSIGIFNENGSSATIDGTRVDYHSEARTAGITSRIEFITQDVPKPELRYYVDTSDTTTYRSFRGVNGMTFSKVSSPSAGTGQLIEVTATFDYRKMRGYGDSNTDFMNGTFTTRVFPRN
jgi:Tfp pilus assembly protein PilV